MRDDIRKFSGMTVALHWLLAVAMIGMLGFGLVLEDMERGEFKSALMWWHEGLGVALLAFAAWRLVWRLGNGMPRAISHMPVWQETAAKATHWFLLAGTLFMPVSGMMMSIGGGHPIDVLGAFTIGPFAKNDALNQVGQFVHGLGGNLLIAAIALHVVGALKHHVVDRDGTLRRMLGARVDAPPVVARSESR